VNHRMTKEPGAHGTLRRGAFPRLTARAISAAAVAVVTALAGAHAASAAEPTTLDATPFTPAAQNQTVTLVTGEQVTAHTVNGATSFSVSGTDAYSSYGSTGGDHYIIPAEAEPFLADGTLSLTLFDVTAMLGAGLTGDARIPVDLTFTAGSTPSAPPGVTLTSIAGSTATGYLTSFSGTAFAAGLRAAIGANVAVNRPADSGTLFGGLISMTSAASAVTPSATAKPQYVLHTLQIDGTDPTGAPWTTLALLENTDSFQSENTAVSLVDGIARIEVPAGHYALGITSYAYNVQGNAVVALLVLDNQFTVPDTPGTTTTVQFDARTATSPISANTPRPSTAQYMSAEWTRTDQTGAGTQILITLRDIPLYVDPQPASTSGSTHFLVQFDNAGPTTGPQYRYDTAFDNADIPADETYRILADQLATVHQDFYTDPAAGTVQDGFATTALDSSDEGFFIISTQAGYAGPVTDYVGTADGGRWVSDATLPSLVTLVGDAHTYVAGRTYEDDWARGPLATNLGQYAASSGLDDACYACGSGGDLSIGYNQLSDSESDHLAISSFGGETFDEALYANGTEVFDQIGATGVNLTGIPSNMTTWREVSDTTLPDDGYVSQSTATHTDLTFHYTPGSADPHSTLPSDYSCAGLPAPCQVLPILTLNYRLAANTENTSSSSVQTMGLTVSHLSYDGYGSHAPITSASVAVSFDDGSTWQPAALNGWNGHYLAIWPNPASAVGTSPELRVTATDATGGSIAQTITAAYTIGEQTP
jgi:hypothetical protein